MAPKKSPKAQPSGRDTKEKAAAQPRRSGRFALLAGGLSVAVGVAAVLLGRGSSLEAPKQGSTKEETAGQNNIDDSSFKNDDWANAKGMAGLRAELLGKDVKQTELAGVEVEPRVVSVSPRIYMFDNLLSPEECDYLIALSEGRLQPAGVVLETADKYARQEISRNNEQIWITYEEESKLPVLQHVLKRLHRVAHVPDTDAEGLQVGRYGPGQKYESHIDSDPSHDVMRPATFLLYLNDVESGGDTLFPLKKSGACKAAWHKTPQGNQTYGCSVCCDYDKEGTIRIRPRKGRAILFFNHDTEMKKDNMALHAACPVNEGVKWIAQRWFRTLPYQRVTFKHDPRFDGVPAGLPEAAASGAEAWDGQVKVLSKKGPRVYLLERFMSAEEAEHLLVLAAGQAQEGAWQVPQASEVEDSVMSRVAKRIHRAAYSPESHGQPLVFRRLDSSSTALTGVLGEGSYASLVVFLEDVEAGGELVIPLGGCTFPACCARGATSKREVRVPARRGRAVLMYMDEERKENGVCPPLQEGASAWLLQRSMQTKAGPRGQAHPEDPRYDLRLPAGQVVF